MKHLTLILTLFFSTLMFSTSEGGEYEIIFSEGVTDAYQSEAIAHGLFEEISFDFKFFVQESHFIYGTKSLNYSLSFKTASVDVNQDGQKEVFVEVSSPNSCGSGGCFTYLLEKRTKNNSNLNGVGNTWEWIKIGEFFGFKINSILLKEKHEYLIIDGFSEAYDYECYYQKTKDNYECITNEKQLVASKMATASGSSPIVGHCTSVESQFENLISKNNYTLIQTSKARDGREVRYYYSSDDYMIAAVDKSAPKYCVQFTHAEISELLTFLIGRYDPTTSGDEGTE